MPPEPVITFFGITRSDDTLVPSSGMNEDGYPIYQRAFSSGFSLVIEGKPGGANTELGSTTYDWNPSDPLTLPDLQILVSHALGNGTATVCDDTLPMIGGVPGFDTPDFAPTQPIADAINDIGCRFKNGSGNPGGRTADEACTIFEDGRFRFVVLGTTLQFCGLINEPLSFPLGDTTVTARIRDKANRLSAPVSIVVRIGG